MREMSDNDILFDAARAAHVRGIMENMGFQVKAYGGEFAPAGSSLQGYDIWQRQAAALSLTCEKTC